MNKQQITAMQGILKVFSENKLTPDEGIEVIQNILDIANKHKPVEEVKTEFKSFAEDPLYTVPPPTTL